MKELGMVNIEALLMVSGCGSSNSQICIIHQDNSMAGVPFVQ
jgi:hypothetical protein